MAISINHDRKQEHLISKDFKKAAQLFPMLTVSPVTFIFEKRLFDFSAFLYSVVKMQSSYTMYKAWQVWNGHWNISFVFPPFPAIPSGLYYSLNTSGVPNEQPNMLLFCLLLSTVFFFLIFIFYSLFEAFLKSRTFK